MKPNVHGDVYRVAFDSANAELNQILVSFEELKARKERIEKVVLALKPLLGATDESDHDSASPSSDSGQPEEIPTYQYQVTNGSSADPFQQRIDQVLGGAGGRDPRRAHRQF
jgi:hypothetical protein